MLVKILHAIAVDCGHRQADLGGPKQRAVLGLLALRVNQAVGVDQLINELWTEDMPGRPRKTVQVYIANLRRVLDRPDRIESGPFGYRLALSDDELDLCRFRRTVSAARAVAGSAPDRAARLYQEALAMWPGQALADLQNHPAVARLGRPLAELRREVVEERIALLLRQGPAAAAIAPLEELIRANEWRERPWTLLMEAHYRCGRQAEALETYQRVRRLLLDELGVEPGPELREMERRILRHDPALGTPPAPAAAVVPAAIADERRTATFVSFAVADYHERARSLDPEDLALLVDEFHALVRRILGEHGGVLDQTADDRVLAHVGHPRAAEDDPHRAVRAALAVVRHSPVAVRAGVHTGLALFRTGQRTGVTGSGPSIAAQVERAAAGPRVHVSAETAALIRGSFDLDRPDGPGDLPGSFVVTGEPAPTPYGLDPVALVGRDPDLAAIRLAIRKAVGPAVVLLRGPAGIGKTAVAAAALAELRASGTVDTTVVIRCDRYRRDEALHPIARALAARYHDSDRLALELGISGLADESLRRQHALLADLAGWGAVAAAPPGNLTGSVAARRGAAVAWLAGQSGRGPLHLLVEDLHDADHETVRMLDDLVDELTGGTLLLTSRADELPPRLAARAHRLELTRLPPADARALVTRTAGPDRLRAATVNRIVRQGAGHPLTLRELTLGATAAGHGTVHGTTRDGGAASTPPTEVPISLQASLLARLDDLGPAKALAQRCSVVRGTFDDRPAARLADDGDAPALLDDLVRAGVLRHTRNGDDAGYEFTHALFQDIAYASLPRDLRLDLHRRMAAWLASTENPDAGRLADHLEAGGDVLPAAAQWLRAAETAVHKAHFLDAAAFARRAVRLLPQMPPGPECDALDLSAHLLLAVSIKTTVTSDPELRAAVQRAHDLATRHGRTDLLEVVYPLLISTLHGSGRYADAGRHGLTGLATARLHADPLLDDVVRQYHAATLVWTGRLAEAEALYDPAGCERGNPGRFTAGRPAIARLRRCSALSLAGLAAFTEGRSARSEELFELSSAAARDGGSSDARCLTDITRAISRQLAGDVPAVHRLAESTLETTIELGSDWWLAWSQMLLGWATAAGGNPDEGVAAMLEVIDHMGEEQQLLPYFRALVAEGDLAAGQPVRALARARGAVALAERTGERFFLPYLHLVLADALDANRAAPDAAGHRARAREVAQRQGQLRWAGR